MPIALGTISNQPDSAAVGTLSLSPRTDAWLATVGKKRTVTVWQDVVELADFARQLEIESNKSRELLEAWLDWGRTAPPTLLYRTEGHLDSYRNPFFLGHANILER